MYVNAVEKWCAANHVTFDAHELRLVSKEFGFAGTTDGAISCPTGRGILDFKTRKTVAGKPCTPYDGQPMQIAAYYAAFRPQPGPNYLMPVDAVGVNVFISTTEPGRVEATWYDWEQLAKEWKAFHAALTIWKHFNNYDPAAA